MGDPSTNPEADVLVVSVVRGPRTFVRVRRGAGSLQQGAVYASVAEAMADVDAWLCERLDDR
jgi:hypothetical protein